MRHSAEKNPDTIVNNNEQYLHKSSKADENLFADFLLSFKGGIGGFIVVFLLIILTKLMAFSIQEASIFTIESIDFIISFWGFIIVSFIQFSHHFK